ncbi:Hpt domain-containing response regulator [Dyella flagellata]|uniref:Hpt domain-containing response regulator n=1 Tax=Dyella flagellata TaxID=1867833 RepID=UPI0024E1369B|nr:Hpt domain-containing protein [Dyella flagellata]
MPRYFMSGPDAVMTDYPSPNSYASPTTKSSGCGAVTDSSASDGANTASRQPLTRILVVDEDRESREILVDQLMSLGVEALGVPDSLAALNAVGYQLPDLILTACAEPGAASYETSMRLAVANRARDARIPIILMTTAVDAFLWSPRGDNGVVDVLCRPVRTEKLQAVLELWLRRPLSARPAPEPPFPPIRSIADFYRLRLTEDIQLFERAWSDRDNILMADLAHHLRGNALMVGAPQVFMLADRLERAITGKKPLGQDALRDILAALKEAIARHFE